MVQDYVDDGEVKTTSRLAMEGRLANPPEYKHTTRTGNPTCKLTFKLRCEGLNELNKEPAFWNWHAFGDLAILCSELSKGQWLSVIGRLGANKWAGDGGQTKLSIHGMIFRIGVRPEPKSKVIKWLGRKTDEGPLAEPQVEAATLNGASAVDSFVGG